jgi:hypothetical protein
LPDEVLEEVALILGEQEMLCLLDHITEVCYECLAFGRELLRWGVDCFGLEEAVERDINLLVLGWVSAMDLGIFRRKRELTDGTLPCWKASGTVLVYTWL